MLDGGTEVDVSSLVERDGVLWFPAREPGEQPPNSPIPNRKGRTAYSEARHNTIVDFTAEGHFLTGACRAAKVTPSTVRNWLKHGAPKQLIVDGDVVEAYPDNGYGKFYLDYNTALAESEHAAVAAVRAQFKDDWRAPMEFLKIRFPKDWSPKQQIEVTVSESDKVSAAKQELFSKLDSIQAGVNKITGDGDGEIIEGEVVEDDDDA